MNRSLLQIFHHPFFEFVLEFDYPNSWNGARSRDKFDFERIYRQKQYEKEKIENEGEKNESKSYPKEEKREIDRFGLITMQIDSPPLFSSKLISP